MTKSILSVAVAGIAVSIAIIAQSQLKQDAESGEAVSAAPSDQTSAPRLPQVPVAPPSRTGPDSSQPAGLPAAGASRAPVPQRNSGQPGLQAPDGALILKRAAAAYSSVKSLRADFVQKRENPLLGSRTTARGKLYQRRPDRFLLKFSEPEGDIIVSDGRYFWLYYPSADRRQVLRTPASTNAAGGVDLQAQFLGDPLRRFNHTYEGTDEVDGRRAYVLTLVPRENPGYKSLKVWIDAKDSMARRFILTENNGVVQEFTLSNLTINPALNDELFEFTPPSDAKIIDRS